MSRFILTVSLEVFWCWKILAANAHNAANAIQSTRARDPLHARPELWLSTAEFSLPCDEPVFGAKLTEIQAVRTINFFVNESANMTPLV
ncbi:hypothetical protein [Burkholderia gladioli]|uniref:hypothetical protein n=1 Tax=Burkholderia gladioli TaxID=28095 RepID=UPI001641E8AD|nr:hypothetical protein [Burkholderia gladioli]